MRFVRKFFGVILCICTVGFISAAAQVEQGMRLYFLVLTGLCLVGAVLLLKKPKNKKVKRRAAQPIYTDPYDTDSSVMLFDRNGKFITRADGQPLTNADVSYLVEKGKTEAIRKADEIRSRGLLTAVQTDVELNSNEVVFFDAFARVLLDAGLNPGYVSLRKLSSGTLNVEYYASCYLGKIHISADEQVVYYMQCLDHTGTIHEYRNISLNDAVDKLSIWMRYAKYFMEEYGYKQALEQQQLRPKLSPKDEELKFQFMQKHGTGSQKRCDEFENLNRLAYEETDLNKKIELLQQAIEAFETTKQWHYNHSKGAKLYFQDFWEHLHNSKCSCFSWVDSVKNELEFQIQKRDSIIPWIMENSKTGFIQTDIYKEFPENSKSELRNIIDELVIKSIIIKTKRGNSYFIICNSLKQIQDKSRLSQD